MVRQNKNFERRKKKNVLAETKKPRGKKKMNEKKRGSFGIQPTKAK